MRSHYKTTFIVAFAVIATAGMTQLRSQFGSIVLELIIFLLSLYTLVRAAGLFTEFSIILGEKFRLNKLAIGILIIAIGTSAPELFSSIASVLKGRPDMAVGNVFGTVIANILLGIGCGALLAKTSLNVHKDILRVQMSVLLGAILLSIASLYDGQLLYYEGIIMLVVLAFYLRGVARSSSGELLAANKEQRAIKQRTNSENNGIFFVFLLLIMNLSFLFISGSFVVSSLIEGATHLGISSTKLATSLLAIGTSVPEIATAVALVRQNNVDSLFGTIIGSNIFDILGIFGFTSLFAPLSMGTDLLVFLSIAVLMTFMLTSAMMHDRKVNRLEGIVLISVFLVFIIQLVKI